jgi:hypothetical protein
MIARAPRLTHDAHAAIKRIGGWTRFLGLMMLTGSIIGIGGLLLIGSTLQNVQWREFVIPMSIVAVVGLLPTWLLMRTSELVNQVPKIATSMDTGRILRNLRAIFLCFAVLGVIGEAVAVVTAANVVKTAKAQGIDVFNPPPPPPSFNNDADDSHVLWSAEMLAGVLVIIAIIAIIRAGTAR